MKSISAFRLSLFALLLCAFALNSSATSFFGKFSNSDGSPQTNTVLLQAWPPVNTWTAYGTNMIYGAYVITNQPNSVGWFSNSAYPNVYRVYVPALDSGFFVNLLDTTNFLSLSVYATNVATFSGSYLNGYGIVTNWLQFPPATNSPAGIIAALNYTPPTNSSATIVNGVLFTNGFQVWLSYKTNGLMGSTLTNLPPGSICTTTNGQIFVLSNTWNLK